MTPEWANFLSDTDYKIYLDLVDRYFEKTKLDFKINDGIIEINDDTLNLGNLGLQNLAQICTQYETKEWEILINSHFDNLINSKKEETDILSKITNFDAMKKYIGVRIYNSSYIEAINKEFLFFKHITKDLIALLIFDFPSTVRNINPDEVNIWNIEIDTLFKIGIENIKNNYSPNISKEKIEDLDVWIIESENIFTSNILFYLSNNPILIGKFGSLVGIPHRHLILVYPIENLETLKAINKLIPIIDHLEKQGPGSLSNRIFWYQNSNYEDLPYTIDEKGISFHPPEEFVEILNKLEN